MESKEKYLRKIEKKPRNMKLLNKTLQKDIEAIEKTK